VPPHVPTAFLSIPKSSMTTATSGRPSGTGAMAANFTPKPETSGGPHEAGAGSAAGRRRHDGEGGTATAGLVVAGPQCDAQPRRPGRCVAVFVATPS